MKVKLLKPVAKKATTKGSDHLQTLYMPGDIVQLSDAKAKEWIAIKVAIKFEEEDEAKFNLQEEKKQIISSQKEKLKAAKEQLAKENEQRKKELKDKVNTKENKTPRRTKAKK